MESSLVLSAEPDLTTECASFPDQIENEILRTDFLDSIDDVFKGDAEVLILDGVEGIGKTTICAQFARRHRSTALSLFVRPGTRMCADRTYIYHDICCQVHLATTRQVFSGDTFPENYLISKLPAMQRLGRKLRRPILFVVDGLSELTDADLPTRQFVLQELLQIGAPGFRVLLTGDPAALLPFMKRTPNHRSQIVTRMQWRDVETYMRDLTIPQQVFTEIDAVCRGNPGRLAQVRRILKSGVSTELLADHLQEAAPDLFRLEWQPVRGLTPEAKLALAIIAHDRFPRTIEQLAAVVKLDVNSLSLAVANLTFIHCDPTTKALRYASETLRKFAADQLRALEPQAISAVIDKLLEDEASEASLLTLPAYLERVGRFEHLMSVLNPEHISRLATKSGSLTVVSDRARLGLTTARRLHLQGDMTRFSIHCSVIAEVLRADSWQAEVAAMVALNDYAGALALAERAVLKEDVLHLLSTIAHAQVEKGKDPDPTIVDQIRRLCTEVDLIDLGPRAFEIASEMVSFAPDLAINLVERSGGSERSNNALDAMYVALTISALQRPDPRDDGAKVLETVKSKIKGPQYKLLSSAVTVWALDYGVDEVLREVEKLEKPEDRLFLLRHWARINASKDDALRVSEYGIRLAIQTTAFATNASLFGELATPLRFARDASGAKAVVSMITPQLATLESTGPPSEYVRLQMHLAVAESSYDREAMGFRFIDAYSTVRAQANLHVRAECTAVLLDTLKTVDRSETLESQLQLHSTIAADLEADLGALLQSTADHYAAAKLVVQALASSGFNLALDITSRLNTQDRRDQVLDELVERILELPSSEINIAHLELAIDRFADKDLHDDRVLDILERLSRDDQYSADSAEGVCRLFGRISKIASAMVRVQAAALAYKVLSKAGGQDQARLQTLSQWQLEAWRKIDVGWHRISLGFNLCSKLASVAPDMARGYVDEISALRREPSIDAHAPASAFYLSLRLAIRTWGGIVRTEETAKERLRQIGYLIDRLPSAGERAKLYASLAVSASVNGRAAMCREIVSTQVDPLLRQIEDERYSWSALVYCGPALYARHRGSALERLRSLPADYRDEAYRLICLMVLGNYDPAEPYKYGIGQGYTVTYEKLLDVIELVDLIDSDSHCYNIVERIADSTIISDRLSREQKADIPRRLEAIIARKFPNPRFIKHDGFKLIATAQKARLETFVRTAWQSLVTEATLIPNTADRAYVITIIASLLPPSERAWRNELFETARLTVSDLPASRDKIERYETLAERALEHNSKFSRECLEAAVQVILNDQNPDEDRAARIMDIAYQIDPEFASSLAALMNPDPAKHLSGRGHQAVAQNASKRLKTLKLSRNLGSGNADVDVVKRDPNISEAAWLKLGELNGGKATVRPYELEGYTQLSGEYPLSQAYPIMCWVIQNSVLRFRNGDQEVSRLVPILDATLLSAGLAQQLAARTLEEFRAAKDDSRIKESRELIVVRPGERDRAFEFVKTWVDSHVQEYIKICDPYFCLADLPILKLIKEVRPNCSVSILTSRIQQQRAGIATPFEDSYKQYYRSHVLSDDPPPTEVVIAGVGSPGDSPIHDRWLLTENSGLRMGTSFNSLGLSKESEISIVAESEAVALESRLDEYLVRKRREFKGQRVSYNIVVL
jgi:hypothetical protein